MGNHPRKKLVFPHDEGDKDTPFDWWYVTSHFATEKGERFGHTVAYTSIGLGQCARLTSMTDETAKSFLGQWMPGAFTSKKSFLDLTYSNPNGDRDYWRWRKGEPFSYILFTGVRKLFSLNVTLRANKPPLIHGSDGVIRMGFGGNSIYFSLTNLSLDGTFQRGGTTESVQGIAWIDRQWGCWQPTRFDGWEWFALQLNDNTEIMLYLFFDFRTGKMITPVLSIMFDDGTSVDLSDENEFKLQYLDYWEAPDMHLPGRLVGLFARWYFSSGWRLTVPRYGIDLSITPIVKNQRIAQSFWEGSCYVNGVHNGFAIDTVCTVELTHRYAHPDQVRWLKNLLQKHLV